MSTDANLDEQLTELVIQRAQADTGIDFGDYRMVIQAMIFQLTVGGNLTDPERFRRSVRSTSARELDTWRVLMPVLRLVLEEQKHSMVPDLLKVLNEEL